MAIACLRLFTFLPERPLFSVPALRFFIARPTLADAFLEYFRAMIILPLRENNLAVARKFRRFRYSAAVRISARSARTAQNLNSGILPNGSSAGLVSRLAAASA